MLPGLIMRWLPWEQLLAMNMLNCWGLVDTVVLSYDSDDAGKRNAVRAVSILNLAEVPVKVLTFLRLKTR
jgi:DNA primase